MKQAAEFNEIEEVEDVPVSPLVRVKREAGYGSVEGLDDEELADPAELERQIWAAEWAPILALPSRHRGRWIQPTIDESGHLDWGAFATVDFERLCPGLDKARYRVERLQEQRKDVLIMLSIVKERLPGHARYVVLKQVRMGVIGLNEIVNEDMQALARLELRARKLREEIRELRERSSEQREKRVEEWLRS